MKQALLFLALLLSGFCYSEDIELADGRILRDVKIVSSDPINLYVVHSGGVENVELSICPLDLQATYGYSPAKAKAYLEKKERDRIEAAQLAARNLQAQKDLLAARSELMKSPENQSDTFNGNAQSYRRVRVVGKVISVTEEGVIIQTIRDVPFSTHQMFEPAPPVRRGADPVMLSVKSRYERRQAAWQQHLEDSKAELAKEDLVFLSDHQNQSVLVDGDHVDVYARYAGRYNYTAVSGAVKTVIRYQYVGTTPFVY